MNVRGQLQRLGLVAPEPPRYRTYRQHPPGPPEPRELPFGPLVVGDDWCPELELWGATKLSIDVRGQPVQAQLSRTLPPAPPVWGGPIPLPIGLYSHSGPFGYFRFRSRVHGAAAVVEGTAFSE